MRPRKRVMLIDSDDVRTSLRRFYLENTGRLRVYAARSAEEACELAISIDLDIVVAVYPLVGADLGKLLDDIHKISPQASSMVIAEAASATPMDVVADAYLLKGACSPAAVIEHARFVLQRKSGPRKTVAAVDHMMMLAAQRVA